MFYGKLISVNAANHILSFFLVCNGNFCFVLVFLFCFGFGFFFFLVLEKGRKEA